MSYSWFSLFHCRYWMYRRCSRRFGTILFVIAATLILNLLLTNTNKPACINNDCSPANAEIERPRDTLEPRDNQVTESFHSQSGQQELTDDEEGCVLDYLATHEDYCRRFLIPKVFNIRYSEFLLPGLHRVNKSTLCPCLPATLGELFQDHLLVKKCCMYYFSLVCLILFSSFFLWSGGGGERTPYRPTCKDPPLTDLLRFEPCQIFFYIKLYCTNNQNGIYRSDQFNSNNTNSINGYSYYRLNDVNVQC